MSTIIENLKNKPSDELLGTIADLEADKIILENELDDLNDKIEDLEEQLDAFDGGKEYNTALGTIYVYNKRGNLKLQEEIDDFFELLMKKYN